MLAALNGGGMVAVLPKSTFPALSLVVFLRSAAGNQLHGLGYHFPTSLVENNQVDVIRCDHVVHYCQAEAPPSLKQPLQPTVSVLCELEQKLSLMAPVSDVPNVPRNIVPIRSSHACAQSYVCLFGPKNGLIGLKLPLFLTSY